MSESTQLRIGFVLFIVIIALLMGFVTVRDEAGLESLHCATCSP
jgi:hypothetical protein